MLSKYERKSIAPLKGKRSVKRLLTVRKIKNDAISGFLVWYYLNN